MQKRGKTANGKQRWMCLACQKSTLRHRHDRTLFWRRKLFETWITGNRSLTEVAQGLGVTRQTLERWFAVFWDEPPPALPPVPNLKHEVLVIDAIYLAGRFHAALIGRTPTRPVHYSFALRESFVSWLEFSEGLGAASAPFAVVLDGQRGGLAMVKALWPSALVQRCLAHVTRRVKNKLTLNPKTEAGRELRALTNALFNVWTPEDRDAWLKAFQVWEDQWLPLALAKTKGLNQNGRQTWWYTHKNLRGGYIHLKNALPNLFTYVNHPNIPRTTNHVEGGINSRLKELIYRHRGFSLLQKQILVATFLVLKGTSESRQKPPQNVT